MYYYLLVLGKIILLLVLVGLTFGVTYLFIQCRRKYLFSDFVNAFKFSRIKRKKSIAVLTVCYGLFAAMVFGENDKQSAWTNIDLTYAEASSGQNPNGGRYNMSDIVSEKVLEDAIDFGGFQNLSVRDLQNALVLTPISGGNSSGLVTTQFQLFFRNTPKTGRIPAKEVVYSVASAYRNWFIDQYATNDSSLDITFDDIESYDYPDLPVYLANKVNLITDFSNAFQTKDGAFVSTETGESFGSINTKAWDIYDKGIESLDAYILYNGLSKNKGEYLSRLRYDNTKLCNGYRTNIQAYDVCIEAIEKYDNDMATVVYIPTYDTDNTFYMSKTKIGIDHFSEDADGYSNAASEELNSILHQKHLMKQLNASEAGKEQYEKADRMVTDLKRQIQLLAEVTKNTVKDYVKTVSNGYISFLPPVSKTGSYVKAVKYAGVFLGMLYAIKALQELRRGQKGRKEYE